MAKVKKRKKKKLTWQQVVLIILVLLLALMLIFSRGYRAARRISVPPPAPAKEQGALPENDALPKKDASDKNVASAENAAFYKSEASYESDATNESSISGSNDMFAASDKHAVNERSGSDDVVDRYVSGPGVIQQEIEIMDVSREQLLGLISPESDDDFVLIDPVYASRSGMYLRREAYDAFLEMREAALADGITLTILSATRSFDHQKRIWENKWHGRQVLHGNILATDIEDPEKRALEILRFSAMPGTSRHHWGTDVDLNSLVNSYFETGTGKRVYEWLKANAADYGFCQPYTRHGNNRTGGYEEEKWHWSYKHVAADFLKAYKNKISYDDIKGFSGSETAISLQVIERFVVDVNTKCFTPL